MGFGSVGKGRGWGWEWETGYIWGGVRSGWLGWVGCGFGMVD